MSRTIYLDSDFKCHLVDDGTMTSVETDVFDGKCDTLIEGYRYIPSGMSWTREDGEVFFGMMLSPWKDYAELEVAQRDYETVRIAEYERALQIVGAKL